MASLTVAEDHEEEEPKKPAAKPITPSSSFHKFYAIRKCHALKAPAIFLDWNDCNFYVEQDEHENQDDVEYKTFDVMRNAMEYIHSYLQPAGEQEQQQATTTCATALKRPAQEASLLPLLETSTVASNKKARKVKDVEPWENFEDRALQYLAFKKKHGRDPKGKKEEHGLGRWFLNVKQQYDDLNEGKPTNLTKEQADRLTKWGFKWNRKSWDMMFEELLAYEESHGDMFVPKLYPGLGNWVHTQRKEFRKKVNGLKSNLKQERVDKLINAGFVFITVQARNRGNVPEFNMDDVADAEEEQENNGKAAHTGATEQTAPKREPYKSWDERFKQLERYKEKYGDCLVPRRYPKLGTWVSSQRKEHKTHYSQGKKSFLCDEKVARLEELGFLFVTRRVAPKYRGKKPPPSAKKPPPPGNNNNKDKQDTVAEGNTHQDTCQQKDSVPDG
jgi:hypothetical protein